MEGPPPQEDALVDPCCCLPLPFALLLTVLAIPKALLMSTNIPTASALTLTGAQRFMSWASLSLTAFSFFLLFHLPFPHLLFLDPAFCPFRLDDCPFLYNRRSYPYARPIFFSRSCVSLLLLIPRVNPLVYYVLDIPVRNDVCMGKSTNSVYP